MKLYSLWRVSILILANKPINLSMLLRILLKVSNLFIFWCLTSIKLGLLEALSLRLGILKLLSVLSVLAVLLIKLS